MANLHDDIGKDIRSCLFDGRVIITGHRDKWVVHVLELRKELYPRFETFCTGEDTAGKIMCGVIHAIQKRNLLLVAFHLHILAIDNQSTTEAFSVAVPGCEVVVVRNVFQLFDYPRIRSIKPSINAVSKRSNAEPLEMKAEKRFGVLAAVIYEEAVTTIVTSVAVNAIPDTIFSCP